jgi:hypothetical protein
MIAESSIIMSQNKPLLFTSKLPQVFCYSDGKLPKQATFAPPPSQQNSNVPFPWWCQPKVISNLRTPTALSSLSTTLLINGPGLSSNFYAILWAQQRFKWYLHFLLIIPQAPQNHSHCSAYMNTQTNLIYTSLLKKLPILKFASWWTLVQIQLTDKVLSGLFDVLNRLVLTVTTSKLDNFTFKSSSTAFHFLKNEQNTGIWLHWASISVQ